MEAILEFLGLRPLKEIEKRLREIRELNNDLETKVDNIEKEIATADGESEWFLCKRVPGGRREGDSDT